MLRITTIQNGDGPVVLKLEGKLLEPWIGELHAACHRAREWSASPTLDLTEISFVDASGTVALRELRQRGMRLVGCSPLVAELIGTAKSST